VAFQSFVVLVFIWLGDGSRLNKSCLHDLGVPYHHCYRVSSPLLVEFISFWYQSFGSKISFVYLLFSFYFLFLAISKKKKKKKKIIPFNLLSARQLLLFHKEKSLHFNLVSTRKLLLFQQEKFFLSVLFLTLFWFLTFL
jgi:hypothetical protein